MSTMSVTMDRGSKLALAPRFLLAVMVIAGLAALAGAVTTTVWMVLASTAIATVATVALVARRFNEDARSSRR